MEIKDSWGLLTELAKINNQDLGIPAMLSIIEVNKELMDVNCATVLLDYTELMPSKVEADAAPYRAIHKYLEPFKESLPLISAMRHAILETLIEEIVTNKTNNK
jgi:hypothetical protein